MQILLVKMSSMGDIIHTLPALTDVIYAIPNAQIDWVIEPAFSDIPTWHPAVSNIIPVALRKWRKNIFSQNTHIEIKEFYRKIKQKKYHAVIDAQGLLKSAIITKLACGKKHGLNKQSAREPLSSYFYHKTYSINKNQHAITRTRILFANALNYTLPPTSPAYGIDTQKLPALPFKTPEKYFVFLHGTTWPTKHYPEIYWRQLLKKTQLQNITVYLPWGNTAEKQQAEQIASMLTNAIVLPSLSIAALATLLKHAARVIAVDTGLGHLSAALSTPTISLYGPTDPIRVGTLGEYQTHLRVDFPCAPCARKTCLHAKKSDIFPPCYATIDPDMIKY